MIIKASTVGTPAQTVVPLGQVATVEAGAVTETDFGGMKSHTLKLPSSAGKAEYSDYWIDVALANPNVWLASYSDPNRRINSDALSFAAEQEWVSNPASGHNTVIEG